MHMYAYLVSISIAFAYVCVCVLRYACCLLPPGAASLWAASLINWELISQGLTWRTARMPVRCMHVYMRTGGGGPPDDDGDDDGGDDVRRVQALGLLLVTCLPSPLRCIISSSPG